MSFNNRRGRGSRGVPNQSYNNNTNRRVEPSKNPRAPIILAKPHHEHRGGPSGRDSADVESYERPPPRSSQTDTRRQVLARKDSTQAGQGEDSSRSVESPRPPSSSTSDNSKQSSYARDAANSLNDYIPPRNIKLVDDNQFCEHFSDYLNENSTDFVIVGVIGTTSVGKSSILNALINPESLHQQQQKSSTEISQKQAGNGNINSSLTPQQRMFRVQTFEKQMLSEHCTNGTYDYLKVCSRTWN